ncbi:T6SS immunity protein Tdi1 domain-containing protein [Pseudomonas sp. PWP3-1b2]|uniref:T6SS immunity protein Tdi1 domain-containing protein n=1 Tax=Pseudomonas sp. PWP3-1b2 TaxID=2804656 RepID=UPI003CF34C4F
MDMVQAIRDSWGWVGIDPVEVVGSTAFGNLMIKDAQGRYWRLCPEGLSCEVIAQTREALDELSRDQTFLQDWYLQPMVEQAEDVLGPLEPGQVYHLVISPVLGGEYAIGNVRRIDHVEQVRFSGDLALEIKDLPDGAHVKIRIVD